MDEFLSAMEKKWPDLLYVHDADLFSIATEGAYAGEKRRVRREPRRRERTGQRRFRASDRWCWSRWTVCARITADFTDTLVPRLLSWIRWRPNLSWCRRPSSLARLRIIRFRRFSPRACHWRWAGMWSASLPAKARSQPCCVNLVMPRARSPRLIPIFRRASVTTRDSRSSAIFLTSRRTPAQTPSSAETPPGDSARGQLNRSMQTLAAALGLSRLYNELYFQYCMKIAPAAGSVDALRRFPSADILVDQAQSWLASIGQRPFFLWIHLMDPHAPYYPPNEAFRELTGRDIEPGRARYLNEYWNRSDLAPSALSGKRDEVVQLYDAGDSVGRPPDRPAGGQSKANASVGRLCVCADRGSR